MAAAAVDQASTGRPTLISRHSSCLPILHARRPVGKESSRRCRSASPPVKKKQSVARCTTSPSEQLKNSIDEICLSLRQDGSSQSPSENFRAPDVPRIYHRKPIIKQLVTSNYSVKQPKPCKVSHPSSTSRLIGAKVLPDRTNPVLASADLNGNLINSSPYSLSPDTTTKARRIDLYNTGSVSYSQPVDSGYPQCDYYSTEPLRKRKPSYSGSNLRSSSNVTSTDATHSVSSFCQLPDEMKLRIFSYLDFMEKGVCMLVCRQWCGMMREPSLWRAIDFRRFRLCYKDHSLADDVANVGGALSKENVRCKQLKRSDLTYSTERYSDYVTSEVTTNCTQACYSYYINRIEGFISFLIDVRPRVRWLAFSFDLISDNWSATVSRFLIHIDLSELTYANINWRDTPVKPTRLDIGTFQSCNDVVSKAKRRQRKYLDFLQLLSQEAVNLETLLTPFTWYDRSTNYLTSFKRLKNLSLEKYFVFRSVKQADLDSILSRIPTLEKLLLELWCGTSTQSTEYRLHSMSIRYLDLSQCRLFYISSIQMPRLETLIISRRPIAGLGSANTCLADILRVGTPNLTRINNIVINSVADLDLNSEVVELLCKVCVCSKHKALAASDNSS